MPEIETITGIAGVRVEKIEYRGAVILKSKLEGRACCPDCQAKAKALRFKEWKLCLPAISEESHLFEESRQIKTPPTSFDMEGSSVGHWGKLVDPDGIEPTAS